jgi:outer membrane receptor protein involved in Fe transport
VLVRNTRFGETGTRFNNPAQNPDENFSSKIITDLNLSFTPKSWLTITAGAKNIFDVYPDLIQDVRNTQEGTNILFIAWKQRRLGFTGDTILWVLRLVFKRKDPSLIFLHSLFRKTTKCY